MRSNISNGSVDVLSGVLGSNLRSLTPLVRFKHEVAVDDHAHRKPRPDRQCRLNVKIALNDFLSGLVQAIAGSTTERCDDITIAARPEVEPSSLPTPSNVDSSAALNKAPQ
jgi:hypothetical protein